jgi:hypothetical protein
MDRDNNIIKLSRVTNCQHENVEPMGFNNGTEFLRCLACRSVIVAQGGLRLAIPPVRTAG